jgi:hypothetical protein
MPQRRRVAGLTFVLYLATLAVDAIRKVAGLSASIIGVVYVITALIYIVIIPETAGRKRATLACTRATSWMERTSHLRCWRSRWEWSS